MIKKTYTFLRVKLPYLTISFAILFSLNLNSQEIAEKFDKEVSIELEDGTLFGSMLVPKSKKKIPVVLLIPGSGRTDRNCNNQGLNTNSFIYLSEALYKKGIASLRIDKRTSGKSLNTFYSSTTIKEIKFNDFISDVKIWIDTLKSGNLFSDIIVAGHSQGALVGLVASIDKEVDKFISISGAGRSIDRIMLDQFNAQLPLYADSTKMFLDSLKNGKYMEDAPSFLIQTFPEYLVDFLKEWFAYDPALLIKELKCPVLIVNGDNDIQISQKEAELLHNANKKSQLLIVEDMSHILKNAPRDRQKNYETYSMENLPLNKKFVKEMISFIKK